MAMSESVFEFSKSNYNVEIGVKKYLNNFKL